ncbi:alpha/beta fold hydrolase [Actinomadura rupiterrae]|uniref:alpha/beta fold hydrolase n=1 Tax=Actinomadura rupiterrae TaxID=559627 RepID=UPI0020A48FFC|nr:alpha/beta hydrolase [Actinomadura rupiterrae]MCP2343834.1 pimeloyl-ACP methyl ester carboxylesterase [Actinomadura rupiterrae]
MADVRTGTVEADGLEFGYLAAGPASGPLALCLHGFPDSAHTWRHLLPELAAAGYRAVAPFMRGYAPTAIPADGAFQTGALAADANALHEVFGGDGEAVLIGHDWGAAAAYGAAGSAPERWRRVVTLALPPTGAILQAFFAYEQLKRSFYVFLMQTPLAAMAMTEDFVAGLWRDWSPGYEAAADVPRFMECMATPAHMEAAIGYYRAMLDSSRHLPRYASEQDATGKPGSQPTLYLHGGSDGCFGADGVFADRAALLAQLPPGSRAEIVPDSGHFLHLERPDEVNRHVLEWLAAR